MSIENILKRIDEETESAVRAIIDKAEEEASHIERDYEARASALGERLELRARKRVEEEERRIIVNEQLELRKSVLARKRQILEELYGEARKKLEEISGDEYLDLLRSLIIKKAVTGREELVVPEKHREYFTPEYIASVNKLLPGGGSLSVSPGAGDFSWGVVLREGRRVVDLTLDVLFKQLQDKVESKVAAILFS
jgi:V/A-type H+-transporting ATPase subunit E